MNKTIVFEVEIKYKTQGNCICEPSMANNLQAVIDNAHRKGLLTVGAIHVDQTTIFIKPS